MKVWITKYALTQGIRVEEATLPDTAPNMAIVGSGDYRGYFHKGQWFDSELAAIADAEMRRTKKIASLRKSITKLEKLVFA